MSKPLLLSLLFIFGILATAQPRKPQGTPQPTSAPSSRRLVETAKAVGTRIQNSSIETTPDPSALPLFLLVGKTGGRVDLFRTQKVGEPEREMKEVVERLFQALKARDFEKYIALWSETSPSYAQQQMLKSRIESKQFDFANLQFSRFSLTGEKATIRVVVTSPTTGDQGGASVRPYFYNFVLVNERRSWKIWSQFDAQSDLATELIRAEKQSDVDSLLKEEGELVNLLLVDELEKRGTAVFFADPKQARRFYDRANEVAREVNRRFPSSETKNKIGITFHLIANTERAQSNYGKVFEYEEQALAFATTPKLKTDSQINIGIAHALQNDLNRAFQFLTNALKLAKDISVEADKNGRLGLIYDSLGNVSSLQEQYDRALNYYRRSLDYRKSEAERAQTFDNIGNAYLKKGDFKAAIEKYNESLGLLDSIQRKEGKDLVLVRATVLNNLASAKLNLDDIPNAIGYAQQTATLAKQISMPELLWRAYLIEAKARSRSDLAAARVLLDDSIKVIEGMRGRAGGGIAGRQRFLEDKLEPYDTLISLLIADGNTAGAFEYSERSKANALLEVLSSGNVFLQRMMEEGEFRQEQQYQSEISRLNSTILQIQIDTKRSSELSELLNRRKQVTDKYDEFLDGIYAKYLRVKAKDGNIIPIKLRDTAELLPNTETAIVEFSVTDHATYGYVITKKDTGPGIDVTTYRVGVTRRALTSQIQKFRGAIDHNSLSYRKLAVDLFALLLGQASERLTGKKR